MKRAGFSESGWENLESLIPLHQVCHFLSSVARSEGYADLGFRIAGRRGMESLGTYRRFVARSLTIHEAIQISVRLTASIIGTSVRTLQRQLADQGTSFSHLLHAIRFRMAQQLLANPNMPLKEIAKRLGYSDLANFIRAFKRWTGVGPSRFRRLYDESRHR